MPTSDPTSSSGPGFRRGKRISDLMTADLYAFVESSIAAERSGDAATALEYHLGIPMFRRSAHRVVLEQLVGLADEMTSWMWARWAAYQCTRAEDPGTESDEIHRAAIDYTLRMFHGDELVRIHDAGGDAMPLITQTLGQDWAYHQLCTHEMGGLEQFLDTMTTGRLADAAGLATEWVGARVGGYRIESCGPGGLVVRDLAAARSVELLDLGAHVHTDAGGWLLGRVVPSGTGPGLMFDTRPLPVDEQTAVEASTGDRRGAWITALDDAIGDGRFDRRLLRSEDRELVTDVPSLALLERGTAPAQLERTLDQLASGRDEIGRAAYRVLRAVAEGSFGGDEDAAYVAAAVVNAHAYPEARRQLVRPGNSAAWLHWAGLVPEPARSRLERLAEAGAAAAA